MKSDTHSERLLIPQEVSVWLGISLSSLSYYRHLDKGPRFIRVGKHVRYHPKDVEAFLAACDSGGGR